MQFSLLKWPTNAPDRMPLSRGLPSASALAVNTSGVPNAIPMNLPRPAAPVTLDADAVALPYQAVARFAAAGGAVTTDMTRLVIDAEAKKRDAWDTVDIDNRYTGLSKNVDENFVQLRRTESDETLIPKFNTMWTASVDAAMQGANPRVQAGLKAKANSLLRVKYGEVTTASTQKFVARQTAEHDQTVATLTKLATHPMLTPAEQALHEQELEKRFQQAAHIGFRSADDLAKQRRETLDTITGERALNQATSDPMGTLEEMSTGNMFGLDAKRARNIADTATNVLKVQRADREHAANLDRQKRKDMQDAHTLTLRQRITENWGPDGKRTSMITEINSQALHVGDDNYKSLLETERIYQALATKPGPKKESDRMVRGQLQAKLTHERFREVTQGELLRLMKEEVITDDDHRYFSARLDSLTEAAKKPSADTEEQKARKAKVKDAEKTIETFIKRGSKFDAQPSEILANEAVVELNRIVAANPDVDPDDVATQLIAKKIAQYQDLLNGLPYQTKEDVVKAYDDGKGPMPRREAERLFAIFDLVEKHKPKKPDTPPSSPGILGTIKRGVTGGGWGGGPSAPSAPKPAAPSNPKRQIP